MLQATAVVSEAPEPVVAATSREGKKKMKTFFMGKEERARLEAEEEAARQVLH
jgi:hypothetical protein